MPALTRGPLPARVYWVRRLMILGTAALLVFALARMLVDSSDASSSPGKGDAARLSADASSSSAPSQDTTLSLTPSPSATPQSTPSAATTSAAPVLVPPVGTCQGSDIAVTPQVPNAVAGRDVTVVLQLRTLSTPACTWRMSPDALAVAVTSGADAIWNSRACRRAIPQQDIVVRKDVTTEVGIVWRQAKRSDETCSARTTWALPGWYHVSAAVLGGEPSDLQFELMTPTAATITVTATPKQRPTKKPAASPTDKPSKQPAKKPSR
jgi:hypothetical protein